jgi:tetratricopeptide (TPR) repeat protein
MNRSDILARLNANDPVGAIALTDRLLPDEPDNPDVLGLKAIAQADTGDSCGAIATLRRALDIPCAIAIRLRNGVNLLSLLSDARRREDAVALLTQGWRWSENRAPDANELRCIAVLAQAMHRLELYDETIALLSPLPGVLVRDWSIVHLLAQALAHRGDTGEALKLLDAQRSPDVVAHEYAALRAHLLRAEGRTEEATREHDAYVASVPPMILPARPGQTLTIGVIEAAPGYGRLSLKPTCNYFTINYPIQLAKDLSHRYRMAGIYFGAGPERVAQFKSWQPDVVINNVTNAEFLRTGDIAQRLQAFIAPIAPRVINPPQAARQCTRQNNPFTLAGIDGLILPKVRRYQRDMSRIDALIARIEDGTDYPMIVRGVYEQKARNMVLVRDRAELGEAIAGVDRSQFYVIQYMGQKHAHDTSRRMRAFFAGGKPTILWVDYARRWIVQSRAFIDLQIYRDHPDLLEQANAIIRNPRQELGDKALDVIAAVGRTIPLDIFGMDFDVDADGNVVFFETNATMRMQVNAPEEFPYPPEARERLFDAIDQFLHRFAATCGQGASA